MSTNYYYLSQGELVSVSGSPDPYEVGGDYELLVDGKYIQNTAVSGSLVYAPGSHPEDYPNDEMGRQRRGSIVSKPR